MTSNATTRVVSDACGRCDGRKVHGQQKRTEGPDTAIGWQPIFGTLIAQRGRVYVTLRTNPLCPITAVSGGSR